MEIAEHIEIVGTEGLRLAEAARRVGLEAEIESCPGWKMRDLVQHLAEIHLWAGAQVSNRATTLSPESIHQVSGWWPELPDLFPPDDELVDFYLVANANLVRELEQAPAGLQCPTFLPAPSPLAMWARRQAHETSIHRHDAESAGPTITPFDGVLAADGIDEILMAFAPRGDSFPIARTRSLAVHTSDTDDDWLVTLSPRGISSVKGVGHADVALRGTASDLYLALWNRGDDSQLSISGDEAVLRAWREGFRIRWSRDRDDDHEGSPEQKEVGRDEEHG